MRKKTMKEEGTCRTARTSEEKEVRGEKGRAREGWGKRFLGPGAGERQLP